MKKNLFNIFLVSFFIIVSCGGGSSSSSSSSSSSENTEDTIVQTETLVDCEGETSADLVDGGGDVAIPEGSLDSCANATPSLTSVEADDTILADEEVIVSADQLAVQLDLDTSASVTAPPEEDDSSDIVLTLDYDDTAIPPADENSLKVYVLAQDQDLGTVIPVIGDLDTAANTITITTKALPANAVFTVVYNSEMAAIASDDSSSSSLVRELTASDWPSNVWCVTYNQADVTLRTAVANVLGIPAASVTDANVSAVIFDQVATNARISGQEFQTLGFRAPHLYVMAASAATRACSGTNSPVYIVHMIYTGGSYFQPDDPAENIDVDSQSGFGTKFGRLYVDANRLDDEATTGLGTVEASIAHEMFHGVQAGYEMMAITDRVEGIVEGTAATLGKTLDGAGTLTSTPVVRDFASEIYKLDYFLLTHSSATRYSNQDFFAYVSREYNSDSFDWLPTFFASLRNRVSALDTAAERQSPPYATVYEALEDGLGDGIFSGLTLSDVYFDFSVNRLVEHNSSSQFGRSGETTAAGTLATGLLRNVGLLSSLLGDPDTLDVTKTSNKMGSFSTRVFKVVPSSASDDEDGRKLTVTVTPSRGSFGESFRVKYYRAGSASGTEASSGSFEVRNWGKTTGDVILVVVSNTQSAFNVTFTYKAVTEEEDQAAVTENSFSATLSIPGYSITFSPTVIVGSDSGSFTGDVTLSDVPSLFAGEGLSASVDIITMAFDKRQGFGPGTYTLDEMDDVFDNQNGEAALIFSGPGITNATNGSFVVFESTSGSVTLTEFGTSVSERLTGSFSATVRGERETGETDSNGDDVEEVLTGTISGTFDVLVE